MLAPGVCKELIPKAFPPGCRCVAEGDFPVKLGEAGSSLWASRSGAGRVWIGARGLQSLGRFS